MHLAFSEQAWPTKKDKFLTINIEIIIAHALEIAYNNNICIFFSQNRYCTDTVCIADLILVLGAQINCILSKHSFIHSFECASVAAAFSLGCQVFSL